MKFNTIFRITVILSYTVFIAFSWIFGFDPGKDISNNFTSFALDMLKVLPCAFILIGLFEAWVKNETVGANDYNPNSVAPPEMELLRLSIEQDGYTQPIVTWDLQDHREVVDGFHRNRVGKECEDIQKTVDFR